jgi:cobalt-zinc-cadmium efflux system membrane fusion protein
MNMHAYTRFFLGLALGLALVTPLTAQETEHDNPMTLDQDTLRKAGIVIDKAGRRALTRRLSAPGEVKANAYATVLVSPRVQAQVLKREARLGDEVKAGQPLVKLSSVEVAKTQGELIVAEQDWRRVSALGKQAVSARRYNESRVKRDQARAKLRAYGLTKAQVGALLRAGSSHADGSFQLLSPIAGRVTTDDFLVGERIKPGRTLFTLSKEDTVWVEAQLAPGDAEQARPDTRVQIRAHGETLDGRVVRRSHMTDETTRTVPVRLRVDNRDDLLHPGELVEAQINVGKATKVLAVPSAAVVLLQNQPTVFVARGKGRFEPVSVQRGETRDGWTEIRDGLKSGDSYVRKGAFALKARLLRSQLGEH